MKVMAVLQAYVYWELATLICIHHLVLVYLLETGRYSLAEASHTSTSTDSSFLFDGACLTCIKTIHALCTEQKFPK